MTVQSGKPASAGAGAPGAVPANVGRGIALMVLGIALFSLMDALIKIATQTYHPFQVVFFRSLFAFLVILPVVFRAGIATLKTDNIVGHLLRSLAGIGTMALFFTGVKVLPLADAIAIGLSAPLFITALSVPFLKERVGPRRWAAVFVGFLGVLVMVRPGFGVFNPWALVPLSAAVLYAIAIIQLRKLSAREGATAMVFYFTLSTTLVMSLTLPFVWVEPPSLEQWALLVSLGLLGGTAQFCLTHAMRLAAPSILASFEYTALLWAILFGYLIWDQVPDAPLMTGAAIVVASGLYIVHREAMRSRAKPVLAEAGAAPPLGE